MPKPGDTARIIAQDYYSSAFDLSARGSAPASSYWSQLPFIECVQFLRDLEIEQRTLCFYITFMAALDQGRHAAKLWWNGLELLDSHPQLFDPVALFQVPAMELADLLTENEVSTSGQRDADAWLRIAQTIALESNCPVSRLIYGSPMDARKLLKDLSAADSSGAKRFPLLGGAKAVLMWLRIMATVGRAQITRIESVPVAVNAHIKRLTVNLGMSKKEGESASAEASYIQSVWKSAADSTDFDAPAPLGGTCIALEAALTFMGRYGCGHCEKTAGPVRFGRACNQCRRW